MKRFLIVLVISSMTLFAYQPVKAAQDPSNKVTNLESKVAKKFSKTFCNSTGFGISNEGALKFALGETKGEFSKKPLIDEIDIESIKEQILIDVGDSCYYFDLTKSDLEDLSFS